MQRILAILFVLNTLAILKAISPSDRATSLERTVGEFSSYTQALVSDEAVSGMLY